MTDFPDLKLKALISFPATVLDGTGIDIVKVNGTYTFNLDFGDFGVGAITDPVHQNILVWNDSTGQYVLVPASVLIPSTPGSALPLMDGVAAAGAATPYSRQDHVHPSDTARAPLASPTFTGDPKAPTPTAGDNDTSIATTQFVTTAVTTATVPPATVAPLMDGVAAVGVATKYAREDHVHASDTSRAAIASPTFTGDPKAPTPTTGDNDTSIATTAFVQTAISGMTVKQQVFTAGGTYTPSTGMRTCIIDCQGAGGGGGGAAAASAGILNGGGGGGGGEFSRVLATAATVGASQTVTIGTAGAAATAGNNVGGNGGATSVGTICTANGGIGGGGAAAGGLGGSGAGGSGGTGSITVGQPGETGSFATATAYQGRNSGAGGDGVWGRGARGVSNAAGAAATGFGGGGGGASDFNTGGNKAGGAGTAGKVVITEFCTQ